MFFHLANQGWVAIVPGVFVYVEWRRCASINRVTTKTRKTRCSGELMISLFALSSGDVLRDGRGVGGREDEPWRCLIMQRFGPR